MFKFNRSHKSFFNRPVIYKNSIVQSEPIHRDNSCPLSYSSTGTFVRNNSISSSIISLLNGKSPYTVFRRIPQRIIDSFNRVFFTGFLPHIIKEGFKTAPFFTYSNTSSTIRRKFKMINIITSISHSKPCTVKRMITKTVFGITLYGFFISGTATRFSCTKIKVAPCTDKKCSTRADTVPFNFSTRIFSGGSTNYCNTVECLTNKIYKTHKLFSVKVTLKRVVAMIQRNHVQPLSLATIGV